MLPLLFLLGFSTADTSHTYAPLQNYKMNFCYKSVFKITDFNGAAYYVRWKFCSPDNAIDPQLIRSTIDYASYWVFVYMEDNHMEKKECRSEESLEIFQITKEDLNDPLRFPDFDFSTSKPLWGMFDPRVSEVGMNSIMITNQGVWNEYILAHELSHYWFSRFCMSSKYSINTEVFARDFENFYRQQ